MRTLLIFAMLAGFAVTSCSRAQRAPSGDAAPLALGELRGDAFSMPPSPCQGDNEFVLRLRSADGSPVRGAAVSMVASMQAMGAMPYMESRADAHETSPGEYRAYYGLTMGGDWALLVRIQPVGGAPLKATGRLHVGTPGLRFEPQASGSSAATARPKPVADADAREPAPAAPVVVEPSTWKRLGITTARATVGSGAATIDVPGVVSYDEAGIADVAVGFSGRLQDLYADHAGAQVRASDVLCSVRSSDALAAEQEFVGTVRNVRARWDSNGGNPLGADAIKLARKKLVALDIPAAAIDSLESNLAIQPYVPVTAPIAGVILEKAVSRGSYINTGQMLFRIAPLSPIWVVASLREQDARLAVTGTSVRITDASNRPLGANGYVVSIAPAVDTETRTLQVRISCPNPGLSLRAGMRVTAHFPGGHGRTVSVPSAALFQQGERSCVYVHLGRGAFEVRPVEVARGQSGQIEILSGLAAGDEVVTTGQFLIAAKAQVEGGPHAP